MEAILNKEQVRPGDETQFMHAAFTSEEEMMTFYLTLNRLVNPVSYFMQRTDVERLTNLLRMLGKFQHFTDLFDVHQSMGIKVLVEGYGLYMMQQTVSKKERLLAAEHVGYQARFFMDVMKESAYAKIMTKILCSHIENVKYLLAKVEEVKDENIEENL